MKPTIEGSNVMNFYMFVKENERGIKTNEGASITELDGEVIIKVEDGELREDNTLQSANGKIINFEDKAFEILKESRKERKTQKRRVSRKDRDIR